MTCKYHEMHDEMLKQVRIVRDYKKSEKERYQARVRFEFWHDQKNALGYESCNCDRWRE